MAKEFKNARRPPLFLRIAALVLLGWSLLAWVLAHALIVRADLPRADAIVVLSGSATIRERTQQAAKLYGEGRATRIILTNDQEQEGWSPSEQRNPYFYEQAFGELQRLGVPRENIEVVGPFVTSTYEEALVLRNYSEINGLGSILLVTSAYHSRRALWTFRRVFQRCRTQVGLEPVETGIQTPPPATWWFHLSGWLIVPTEYVKMVYYRVRVK